MLDSIDRWIDFDYDISTIRRSVHKENAPISFCHILTYL